MTWTLGETVRESFQTPVAGETFTRTLSQINGVATPFDPTFTDLGGGFYEYAYIPIVAGAYAWMGGASLSGDLTINFEVDSGAPTTTRSTATSSGGYVVGETVQEGFSTDSPHETFTIFESRDPDGLDFLTVSNITELGTEGQYLLSFLPGKPGNYFAHWGGDASGVHLDGNWEITGGTAETAFPTNNSRLILRRRIGGPSGLSDMIPVVAAAGSTDVTFVDPVRITLPTGAYLGRELYVSSGANAGLSRQVRGSGELSTSLTVAPAFPSPFALNDEAEIWNTSGSGWHAYEVNTIINEIIVDARSGMWIPTNTQIADRFNATRNYLDIPASLTHVIGVAWLDDGGSYQEIGVAEYPGGPGWYLDPASRTIRLGGDALWAADTRSMQVRGYAALAELDQDTDTTPLNVEWLVKEACARLLLSGLDRRPVNQVKFPAAQRRADQARGFTFTRPHPNMTRVIA